MGKKKRERLPLTQTPELGSALGDALKAVGFKSSNTPASSPKQQPPTGSELIDFKSLKKVLIRIEKKGRGGKTVTVIEGITASVASLESLAKDLRQELGCGARVEAQHLVIQGDLRDRAFKWFTQKGVKKTVQL